MVNSYSGNPDDSNYPSLNNMGPPEANTELNRYAQDYLNTVKENRSLYGNYVDNALAYDPYKEQKSVYNVVYETDSYNPWGKPGGGAPKVDNTGHVKTKIVGTLRWNLNGETEDDRAKRLANSQKNTNVLLYKKNPSSPQNTPRLGNTDHRQVTTYNYNYRDPYINSSQNFNHQSNGHTSPLQTLPNIPNAYQPAQQQQSPYELTKIEREAEMRSLNRTNSINFKGGMGNKNLRKSDHELNRISNKLYTDNQPTVDYPNNPYWFGRAGANHTSGGMRNINKNYPMSNYAVPSTAPEPNTQGGVQYFDARKRNLLDALENRTPNTNSQYMNYN